MHAPRTENIFVCATARSRCFYGCFLACASHRAESEVIMAVAKPWNCALRKLKLDLSLPRRSRANRWQVEDTTLGVVGTPPGGRGFG